MSPRITLHASEPGEAVSCHAVGGGDELKIKDFGLAKVLRGGTGVTESLTEAGAVMGTFGYIALEVFTGGAVDERADIFAIGVMMVETFVGWMPGCVNHTWWLRCWSVFDGSCWIIECYQVSAENSFRGQKVLDYPRS